MGTIPKYLFDSIAEAEHIFLFTHCRPDGDALGSMFGLAQILREIGKTVSCFVEEAIPAAFHFFTQDQAVHIGTGYLKASDYDSTGSFGIALDCGDLQRLGIFSELFLEIPHTFAIDHHKSHEPFGEQRWVDALSSSTGEMVYEIAEQMNAVVDAEAALCLYVAICTDTGGFRFGCTRPRTHVIASKLLECGVKPDHVGEHLYDNWSLPRLQLMKMVLATLLLSEDGKIASVYVDQDMLLATGASLADTEGFIDYPRSLSGVMVAVFLKESADRNTITISMRAKGGCDVANVAGLFGGGGHCNAAGCSMESSTILDARQFIIRAVEEALS